ncbi:DNA-binding, integrase-type, partial [Cynara cardunculus var. scolymus]
MATTAAADDDSDRPPLRRDSVPVVDLRLLSQSELYSLSLSSDSSFDLNRGDDVVIPKINRSVFNESAGSRKQTYSRLRLASAESSATTKTTTLHRRTPHLRSSHTTSSNNINDPEQAENSQIIRMLKHLCKSDPNFQDVVENEDENDSNSVVPEFLNPENLGIKRKRGRPRKHENVVFLRPPTAKRIRNNTVKKVVVFDHERDREIVNDRGVPVNLTTLAGLEDPYGPEIRRRTVGMSTEDELLGFLRGLNGQWGSRRKKRRVVDAIEFGDVLPKGWRLSLCIKKKEGRVWLFCRRYISPSGQQFESCKEISTYLISVIGQENLDKPNHIDINSCDDNAFKGASVNAADLVLQEDIKRDGPINNPSSSSSCPVNNPSSSPPAPPLPTNCEEQVTMDIEDAMDVQIGDVFKCLKCSLIFEGKDNLLDHQAKRNESVASLGSSHDGLNRDVLDFNTKSNLEFCSLVPSENEQAFSFQDDVTCLYDRAMEECKQESSERGLLNHFSIADTSDDIFENKIYSTPLDGLKFDDDRDISSNELSLAFGNPHALYPDAIRVEQKKDLVSCSVVPSKIDEAFDVHTSLSMVNNSMVENLKAGRGSVGGLFNLSCNDKTSSFPNGGNTVYPGRAWEGMKSDEFKNSGNKFTTGFGSNHGQTHEVVPSGMWKTTGDGNQLQSGLSTPSHPQIQSPSSFHSFNIMLEMDSLDLMKGFGVSGMRSSRPEPVEFSFLTGRSQHNPHPLQGDSRVFSYNAGMEQQFDSSFWLGKNGMMPSTGGRNQITSVCAWCRNEFHLQPVHPGTQDGIVQECQGMSTCCRTISAFSRAVFPREHK